MTNLQAALAYIAEANFADYFALMDKALGKNTQLALFKKEFISGLYKADFIDRLTTFAQSELSKLPTAHKFLTDCTKPADFVGRETELVALHKFLDEGKKSVIVNGLGGIGKTSLALQYVWQYKEHYHHIVWVEQQSSLLLAFMTEKKLNELVTPEKEEAEVYFYRLMQFLEATEGKNLLVIDNYEDTEADKTIAILTQIQNVHFAHWRVLFTSREKVNGFALIALDTLPKDEAIALFKLHSENRLFDENVLVQILEEVDYHTLTIELLSKIYANDVDVTLTNLLTVLQQKDFDNELVQEMVTTKHHKGEANLYKHLLLLFNMEKWTADEQHLLKQFAALPSLPINGKQLLDWLQNNRQTYKKALQNLTHKGWITKDQENYTMHRLLKILIQKHLGVKWEEVKVLVESVQKEVTDEKVQANPLAAKPFVAYIDSFITTIDFQNNEIEESYLLSTLGYIHHYTSVYTQAEKYYTKALVIVQHQEGTENIEYSEILNNLALAYDNQGKYEDAILLYQEALKIQKEVLGEKHPDYAISLNNLAFVYGEQEKHQKAIILFQQVLQIQKEILGEKHPDYANSLSNLAGVYDKQEKYKEAIPLYYEALKIWKEVLGEKHPTYATCLNNLAFVYNNLQKYKKAITLYQEALQIRKEVLGEKHLDYAATLNNLALAYTHQRKYKEAIPLHKEALQIQKEILGEKHYSYATSLHSLAFVYEQKGNYETAIILYQEALEIRKEVLGEKHPDYAISLHSLAFVYEQKGNYETAIILYQEALEIRKEVLGEKHPDYAISLHSLAFVYEQKGNYETAIILYQEALEIRKEVLGEKHPDYAITLNNLAIIYNKQGKYEEAIALYQEVLQIMENTRGKKHYYYANPLCNLGDVYYNLQNYEQALNLLQEAYPVLLNDLGDEHTLTKKCKGYLDKTLQALQNKT